MSGKVLRVAACAAFSLTLASGALFAQSGARTIHITPSQPFNIPSQAPPPANIKIFTNLGPTSVDNYDDGNGTYVLGSANTLFDPEQWIAVPFTPTRASHVTMVQTAIGVLTVGSPGQFMLGIYSDNAGKVGTLLGSTNANATAVFGTCCTLTVGHFSGAGIALTANTKYWVVASPNDARNAAFTAAWAASNLISYGLNLPGSGGWLTQSLNDPAVAVLGTSP